MADGSHPPRRDGGTACCPWRRPSSPCWSSGPCWSPPIGSCGSRPRPSCASRSRASSSSGSRSCCRRGRIRVVAGAIGVLIGLLAIVRLLDLGFHEALHRPFNPVNDWRLLDPALVALRDSFGTGWADAAVVGAVVLVVVVPAAVALSVIRICRVAARRRALTAGTAGSLGVLWVVCALLGVQVVLGAPVASRSAAQLAVTQVQDAVHNLRDLPAFRAELAAPDPWSTVAAADLLTGLRGKDVVLVFVESYGRVRDRGILLRAGHPGPARRRHGDAGRRGIRLAQRVPDLVDVRRGQLAGPRDPALRAVGGHPAAPRPAARERPVHAERGVRAGGLADGRGRAVQPGPVAGGEGVLPLRRRLRPHRRRVRGPQVQLRGRPRPVHAGGLRAAGAGAGSCPGHGRDRPGLVARAVDAVAAAARLGRARGRLGLRRHARRRPGTPRRGRGRRPGQGAVRGVDRVRAQLGASRG